MAKSDSKEKEIKDVAKSRRRQAAETRMLEKLKKYQDHWDSLPHGAKVITELLAIRQALQSEIMDDDGKLISLWDYAVNRELEVLSAETGFARDTDEDPEDIIASKPGWMLRSNAPKMQLRESEENNLELDCMGQGFQAKFSAAHDVPGLCDFIAPRLDFAYGVFCKGELIKPLLERYSGRAPAEMLLADRFYQDLILHSPQLETTVMLVPTRDLPLANLQRNYIGKLMERVRQGITFSHLNEEGAETSEHVSPDDEDVRQADELAAVFSPTVLKGLPFMSADGKNIKANTQFLMSTNPEGGFCIEAISPGTLAQQRTFYIGEYSSKHLTYAMLDSFMGPNAIDPVAQLDIGACYLYFANGFKLDRGDDDENRMEETDELLMNSEQYFHPSGQLMVPEGQSVPGLKGDQSLDDEEDIDDYEDDDDEAGQSKGSGQVAQRESPPGRVPMQAASVTLRHFSLPRINVAHVTVGSRGYGCRPAVEPGLGGPKAFLRKCVEDLGRLKLPRVPWES